MSRLRPVPISLLDLLLGRAVRHSKNLIRIKSHQNVPDWNSTKILSRALAKLIGFATVVWRLASAAKLRRRYGRGMKKVLDEC
jgi:hypothetical protein